MTMRPRSFRGRLLLLLLGALVASQAIAFALFLDERRGAVRAAAGAEIASRTAGVIRLLESAPPELRPTVLAAVGSRHARYRVDPAPLVPEAEAGGWPRLAAWIAEGGAREVRVRVTERPRRMADDRPRRGAAGLQVSARLTSGEWLNLDLRLPRPPLAVALPALVATLLAAALVTLIVLVSTRRLAAPVAALAEGADRLGRGAPAEPLPVTGPEEIRRATEAFNRMQSRLTRLLDERTRMVAALAHDLRSPLAAMRVRLEMIEEGEDRDRLIALAGEMERMTEATLAYGRGVHAAEPPAPTDLAALAAEIAADLSAEGAAVRLTAPASVLASVRPTALKRALRNLVDNALRYAGAAEITVDLAASKPRIAVEDRGPGIPESELERVFEPFARLESSRSRDTGGAGLGLAIARDVLRAHGGDLVLENRPGGGLRAVATLPVAQGTARR